MMILGLASLKMLWPLFYLPESRSPSPLAGLIDQKTQTQRLDQELESMDKEIKRVTGKLNNAGFLAKAPADVFEKEKAKAEGLER